MHAGIQRLRDNPKLGRDRQDIRRGYHSLLIGRHVLFYRFDDQECEIVMDRTTSYPGGGLAVKRMNCH